ncbi:MBL fold metallo-hydrolase [Leptothrix ochracea]|uniref:MBL fold metallo-hydrolase n=2 Tax=Leptothrix ochracea TaxID=735331 RepID=UPI00387EA68D
MSLRIACGLLWVALMGAGVAQAQRVEPATVPLQLVQVAPAIYFVQGESAMGSAANQNFISNAGVIVTDDGVVVIDALGSPPLAQRLIDEIAKITPLPIRWVIVTHYHADHVYGLQAFRALGAKIVAHSAAREYLQSDTARLRMEASRQELFPWIDESTQLQDPDQWLADPPWHLKVGSTELVIKHVGPAHTPEDVVVYMPAAGVLFAGDLVFRGRVPFVGQANSRRWIDALDKLLAFDARIVVPGHGAISTDVGTDLRQTRDYLAYLRQTMGEAAANMEPFEEAYARVDWSRFAKMPLFAVANRMNAYNTYLLMEQEGKKP